MTINFITELFGRDSQSNSRLNTRIKLPKSFPSLNPISSTLQTNHNFYTPSPISSLQRAQSPILLTRQPLIKMCQEYLFTYTCEDLDTNLRHEENNFETCLCLNVNQHPAFCSANTQKLILRQNEHKCTPCSNFYYLRTVDNGGPLPSEQSKKIQGEVCSLEIGLELGDSRQVG